MNSSIKKFPPKIKRHKKTHHCIAVGVILKKALVLVSKRKEGGLLGGLWEFPGGKIINSETAEDCIRREVLEELGISVAPKRFIKQIQHEYTHFSISLCAYFCDYLDGEPRSIECADWRWIDRKEIYKLPFPKANQKLFGALEKGWDYAEI